MASVPIFRALLASTKHPPPVKLQIVAAMAQTLPSRAGLTSADVEGFALLACGWLGVEGLAENGVVSRAAGAHLLRALTTCNVGND